MHRLMIGLTLFALAGSLHAEQVVDDFEAGTNADGWTWLSGSPGGLNYHGVIQTQGGNPNAWFDSTAPYFSDHPNFTAVPDVGTPLRAALDSGTLHSASVDIQRLDTSAVENCHPVYDMASVFTLELFDVHTLGTDPPSLIEAHTTDGPASPAGISYPWTSLSFAIPSDATDVPPGWELNAPDGYTWSDLMHNVDGISFFVLSPSMMTFDSCWQLGADNATVAYGTVIDTIFVDGFEGSERP